LPETLRNRQLFGTTPALMASKNYVQKGSGKVKLSPKRPRRGTWRVDFETQIKEGFGHGVSLSLYIYILEI
jgi:hypothetical protein